MDDWGFVPRSLITSKIDLPLHDKAMSDHQRSSSSHASFNCFSHFTILIYSLAELRLGYSQTFLRLTTNTGDRQASFWWGEVGDRVWEENLWRQRTKEVTKQRQKWWRGHVFQLPGAIMFVIISHPPVGCKSLRCIYDGGGAASKRCQMRVVAYVARLLPCLLRCSPPNDGMITWTHGRLRAHANDSPKGSFSRSH